MKYETIGETLRIPKRVVGTFSAERFPRYSRIPENGLWPFFLPDSGQLSLLLGDGGQPGPLLGDVGQPGLLPGDGG